MPDCPSCASTPERTDRPASATASPTSTATGTSELLIGQISGDEFTDKVIFDAYTLVDGAPVQLFQSRERARYYLCGDNTVAFEGSSGADSSDSELYSVSGGVLTAISGTPDSANYVRPEFTAFSNY